MKTEDFKILFHWSEARKLVNIPNETEFTGDKAFKFLEIVKNIDKSKKKLGLGYYKTKLTFNFGKDIQHELRIDLGDGDLLLKPNAFDSLLQRIILYFTFTLKNKSFYCPTDIEKEDYRKALITYQNIKLEN